MTDVHTTNQKGDRADNALPPSSKTRLKDLFLVFAGTAVFLLMLYAADNISPLFKYGHSKIAEEEIEAGAIFYTGVAKVTEAERFIRSSTNYSPLKEMTYKDTEKR
ncbi:MAG: hypothetical protein SNJ53_05840 [Thermodesulfovibrionales bacterium]